MGRKRKPLVDKSPFKLRRRKLTDGHMSLCLDRSVNVGYVYEFLQLCDMRDSTTVLTAVYHTCRKSAISRT